MQLSSLDQSSEIIDDLLDCFTLFNNDQEDKLKEKIPDESYLRNFIGLAKRIAPDGDKVKLVGLTASYNGQTRPVAITRKQKEISVTSIESSSNKETQERISVTGRLLLADATKKKDRIQLIDDGGKPHNVIVPEGMMTDIVRPLWDDIVTVTGVRTKSRLLLEGIEKASNQ
jgi:hypothetical protein